MVAKMLRSVGVLALQGDFKEHLAILASHGISAKEVRTVNDLGECAALIIPGGESTTMAKLLESTGLDAAVKNRVKNGMPFYGTCAGAILAARKVLGEARFKPLGIIDIEVRRNAYGRQADSFEAEFEVKGSGRVNGVFIRAPIITKACRGVEVLATLSGKPVLAKQGKVIVGTFHPETEKNFLVHELLLGLV